MLGDEDGGADAPVKADSAVPAIPSGPVNKIDTHERSKPLVGSGAPEPLETRERPRPS